MDAIKKALFEKAWEKEQNYNDAVARWGEDNLASKLYWTVFNPLFEVIQNAGLEVEYHRWVREKREGRG